MKKNAYSLPALLWTITMIFTMQVNGEESPSLLTGAFNEAQAIRGQALYYQHCLNCHGEDMAGVDKAPQLAGPQFNSNWDQAPLSTLVARISTMPPEKPGSLSRSENVDILTYMLWYNGLPLGENELAPEQSILSEMTYQIPGSY